MRTTTETDRERDTPGFTILDLRPSQCRWPLDDPNGGAFRFCGCERAPGRPYCAEHAKRAYVSLTKIWGTR